MKFKQLAERTRRKATLAEPLTVDAVVQTLLGSRDDDVPLYISAGDYFIYGVFVPTELLNGDEAVADILGWNMGVPSGYGVAYTYKKGGIQPSLAESLDHTSSSILDRGIASLYRREFEAKGSYIDADQRLTHALELHHAEAKGGWCRLNHLGETVVVLRVDRSQGFVCTLDREAMDVFLATTDMSLVRVVDVTTTSVGFDGPRAVR